MGYNIKQKIEICLKAEAEPHLTQMDLAHWAMKQYGSSKPPSQTTISRILSSKNDIIGSKEADFLLILTEWITQAHWEQIPITTPIIQLTAYAIWTRLPTRMKDGNGLFNHKWCNNFVKKLNINLTGTPETIRENLGYKLNKEWKLDEKLELKNYIRNLIAKENYSPRDIFTIDEFSLFYLLPLDQIFDILSIDKGLKQSSSSTENMLTIMLGCNVDGSEKLNPLVVSKHETFDVSDSCHASLKANNIALLTPQALINKVGEVYLITYKSNNNKWITSSMFQDYLLTLDHKLENSTPNRNILILLDNSSSHRMINLEFKHIRLVYLENTSKHKNPFNGSNSAKFDYLPMSFGIVEEFKILYRLQQYLEMINKQRRNVELDQSTLPVLGSSLNLPKIEGANNSEVLSESDYQVPFIKVIEWIRRSGSPSAPK
ncbi:CIC11C00000000018 [Sungouiella intermedia]|uniref:CIC11C00000000018 n=1 Tax=Sungouiella intermedia TaxID=45354 RepID=A0A1L0DBI5_9ASCO|nr:CIC11C00000000018 [[Candida] intermedia]